MLNVGRLCLRGGRVVTSASVKAGVGMPKGLAVRSFSAVPSGGSDAPSSVVEPLPAPVVESLPAPEPGSLAELVANMNTTAVETVASTDHNFIVRGVMDFIENIHVMADVPYWGAIALTTVVLRTCVMPIAIKTIQSSSRMANMRPELQKVQDAMNKDPNIGEMNTKLKYQKEMQALFLKYKVNPLRAVMWPFFQFPIFIAFFMALQGMGGVYPGMATGGALWFTDLTAPDSTYILPILNSLSFLAMLELGSDGVQIDQQSKFKMIMRGLSVAMVPLTASMPQGVFVYWMINNVFSITQTAILKSNGVRQMFDIPAMPAPNSAPALKVRNPFAAMSELIQKEKSVNDKAKAEIIDGISVPKAPTSPVKTYSAPPKKN